MAVVRSCPSDGAGNCDSTPDVQDISSLADAVAHMTGRLYLPVQMLRYRGY